MVKGRTYSGVLPFTVSAAIPRNFPIGTQREMHFVPRIAAQSAHVFSDPTFFPRRWSEKAAVAGHLGNNVACMLALEMVSNKMTTQQLTPFEVGQVKAHVEHGLSALAISQKVCKADGKTKFGESCERRGCFERRSCKRAHTLPELLKVMRESPAKCNVALETDTLPQHFEAVREKNTDQTNEIWNDCSQPP